MLPSLPYYYSYYDYQYLFSVYVTCPFTIAGPLSHSNCFHLDPSWWEMGWAVHTLLTFCDSGAQECPESWMWRDAGYSVRTEKLHSNGVMINKQSVTVVCQQWVQQPAWIWCLCWWRERLSVPSPLFLFPVILPSHFLYPACGFSQQAGFFQQAGLVGRYAMESFFWFEQRPFFP